MNSDKFFIITIDKDAALSSFNYREFHNKLISTNGVKAWWHYLESTYIIKVDFSVKANHIADLMKIIAPNKKFFATEINLNDYSGWLPQEAWDWIRDNAKQNNG